MTVDNILEEIKKAERIVILTHENPDGDAIGSSLAMYKTLEKMGKQADLIIPEVPRVFNFLPGIDKIKKEGSNEPYDLAIALDAATLKMLNGWGKYFETAKVKIVIDHHGTNTMYGDINFVNPDAPACAQIMLVILENFGIEITKEIEKKYAKKTNALILCAQYKPFDFLCKVLEFVCIEKKVKLPQNIIQDLRKTALAREIFCSEREIDELFTKCDLTNKNKLYTI